MLRLKIPAAELWNEKTNEFEYTKPVELELEHSLVSLSKWESFYEKPFLNNEGLTDKETLYYIECMCITQDIDPEVFNFLTDKNIQQVNSYISKKHTATWFSDTPKENVSNGADKTVVTSEIIYYWMISLGVPFEAQFWNLNRLLTLIRVLNIKNKPPEKLTKEEAIARVRDINAKHRQKETSKKG